MESEKNLKICIHLSSLTFSLKRIKTRRRHCLDVKDYIKKSKRKLSSTKHYRHLDHETTTENIKVNKIRIRLENDKLITSNVVSAEIKCFTKDLYKLLNKSLSFPLTIKKFNDLDEEMNDFYRLFKLKAYYYY